MVNVKTQPLNQRGFNLQVHILSALHQPSPALIHALDQEGIVWAFGAQRLDSQIPNAVIYDLTTADMRFVENSEPAAGGRMPTILAVERVQLPKVHTDIQYDDFFVLPCSIGEISARILRLLELAKPAPAPGVIYADDLIIDTNRYDVFLAGRSILLTFKEYELLKLLAANPGRVYGRETLLEQVWGYAYFGGTRTVDVHVRRLRSKIEDSNHTFIDTVWNVGYRFRADIKLHQSTQINPDDW